MNKKANNIKTVPFIGERLHQHQSWMQVMSEGELTPASSVNRMGSRASSSTSGQCSTIPSRL